IEPAAGDDFRINPTFWRVRIHIVEVLEVRGILEIAKGRHAVTLDPFHPIFRRHGLPQRHRGHRSRSQHESLTTREQPPNCHERHLTFAAFSPSHHQTAGKPDIPYFGSTSGWP